MSTISRRLEQTHRLVSLWSLTPRNETARYTKSTFALSLEVAFARVRLQAIEVITRDAGAAMPPFGSGRPVRPWLVVNPSGGMAAPRALWLQHFSRNILPAATWLPRGQVFSVSELSTLFRALRGAANPAPSDGSQQGLTGATLFKPKVENIMANIGRCLPPLRLTPTYADRLERHEQSQLSQ